MSQTPKLFEAKSSTKNLQNILEERQTPEIVVGLVGQVGSGVSKTGEIIRRYLEEDYGYEVFDYRVSDIIRDCAELVNEKVSSDPSPAERIIEALTVLLANPRCAMSPGPTR